MLTVVDVVSNTLCSDNTPSRFRRFRRGRSSRCMQRRNVGRSESRIETIRAMYSVLETSARFMITDKLPCCEKVATAPGPMSTRIIEHDFRIICVRLQKLGDVTYKPPAAANRILRIVACRAFVIVNDKRQVQRETSLKITSTHAHARPMNQVVLPAPRQPFGGCKHGIESCAVQVSTVRHHAGDAPDVANVRERVAVDQDEVRGHPLRDRSELVGLLEIASRIERGRAQ